MKNLINKIKEGKISLTNAKSDQAIFKSHLGDYKKWRQKKKKSKEKKKIIYNVSMLYKARNEVIKFFDDYSLMISEAKNKANKKQDLKY